MPLPWVRLDTNFWSNPKILELLAEPDGYRAAYLWIASLAYSGSHGCDGYVTAAVTPMLLGIPVTKSRVSARLLVKYGFWIEQPGGWLINDWQDYQESNGDTQRRRIRAQSSAAARLAEPIKPMTGAERQRRYRERHSDETPRYVTSDEVTSQ